MSVFPSTKKAVTLDMNCTKEQHDYTWFWISWDKCFAIKRSFLSGCGLRPKNSPYVFIFPFKVPNRRLTEIEASDHLQKLREYVHFYMDKMDFIFVWKIDISLNINNHYSIKWKLFREQMNFFFLSVSFR